MTREPDPLGAALSAALSAALRREQDGADTGEARAREAFRAARDGAGYAARRTRRRDDWRSVTVRGRWRGSLRTTALGVAATVLLGGVAVAASGTLDPDPPAPAPVQDNPEAPEPPEASPRASAVPTAGDLAPDRRDRRTRKTMGRDPDADIGKGMDKDRGKDKDNGKFKTKVEKSKVHDPKRAGSKDQRP
ncbi:hypothetical protein [Streptomyces sp. NPDC046712]|uniref:hypothetical protein n=1 Tax=Streptomyces sp. NPDC046712 TaxID=3154802 RepID=UPI00340A4046